MVELPFNESYDKLYHAFFRFGKVDSLHTHALIWNAKLNWFAQSAERTFTHNIFFLGNDFVYTMKSLVKKKLTPVEWGFVA